MQGVNPYRRDHKQSAAIAQVKDMGDRLGAVEEQVEAISNVAGQLADLVKELKKAQEEAWLQSIRPSCEALNL